MLVESRGKLFMKLTLLFVLVFQVLILNAQIRNIKFNHLTDANGLSQNHGMCAFQDSKGFMWFGTYAGLNRYDGSNFKVYLSDQTDSTTISDNWIMKVQEDGYGNLWLAADADGRKPE